ncbi:MAG: sigma-54-dependent Fis family transcriptional regulator [Myxococcales bacterium]|nr:sigma-54-dependent Fis family transcriptional regulator [Myxococcales bacterium]
MHLCSSPVQGLFGAVGRELGRLVFGPGLVPVIEQIEAAAAGRHAVLITGESGTGKELVAECIHRLGPRWDGPFVAINCGGLSRELVESELFGHARGAYTSAHTSRPGAFQSAHGGVLFLDEVGELPTPAQAALLRTLETGRIRPVGTELERPVDVRIVTATHRDLATLAEDGQFRMDLVFRLDVLRVHMPPLRDRLEDLPLLVPTLLTRAGLRAEVTTGAVDALSEHTWPGNIRELRNVLIRAAQLGQGQIDTQHVRAALSRATQPYRPMLRGHDAGILGPPSASTPDGLHRAGPIIVRGPLLDLGPRPREPQQRSRVRRSVRRLAVELYEDLGRSGTRTAAELGVARSTLYRWLKEHGEPLQRVEAPVHAVASTTRI